jgi:hypothetical protein
MNKLPVFEMLIDESDDSDLMVDFIALVDKPAIQKDFMKFAEEFINPSKGEHKTEFLPRCISYVINEGKESEQAVAICNSLWDEHFAGQKVSYDYDDTLSTERGKELAKASIENGDVVYIISARQDKDAMLGTADELGIHHSRVYATGSNKSKIEKVKELGIDKHIDNNADVIYELGSIGQKFTEDSYSDYPDAVKNNAKAALKYAEENGWGSCGTEVGKQRANQLAKGEPISFETIKRMYSYLSRHEVDLESSKGYGDGCGKLMYDAWGGKSALSWAESKINQIERKAFAIQSEEQRIISGPLMVANQRIKRFDKKRGEYEVFFSPATIKKIAIKLAKKGFQNNVNLMHSADMKLEGITLFEIFQSDKERGIMPIKGFEDLADGSLFGSMYVDNDQAWQLIKEGKVKGFSVEGNFGMKRKDKYDEQMEEIISILSETK